ncbi:hypothetical protein YB2330_004469 [Saitoella coloradoensis]
MHTGTPVALHINGRDITTSTTFPVLNPLSNSPVHSSSSASKSEWSAALKAAEDAFETWRDTSPSTRRLIFLKAADILSGWEDKAKEFMTAEVAATPSWVKVNLNAAVAQFREVAGLATHIKGEIVPADRPNTTIMVLREAAGVVFGVAPWNAPITLTVRAIATPIMCGNTVILKPSEFSPGSQRLVVDALLQAGLPKGVLNYLPVSTPDAPAMTEFFVRAPSVRRVNFTGSTRVGKIIARLAAEELKPCVLELGGKAPAIVRADADLPSAAKAIIFGGLCNAGQVCMSTERVLVHESIVTAFRSELIAHCKSLKTGDGGQISGLQTGAAAKKVVELIQSAKSQGAEILLGDCKIKRNSLLGPHVVSGVTTSMDIWSTESFGPVLSLTTFSTDAEAIRLANSSTYSLCGSVFTRDTLAGTQICRKLRCGATHVNGPTVYIEPTLPNGGVGGASGYGRFGGMSGVDEFMDKRIVTVCAAGTEFNLA